MSRTSAVDSIIQTVSGALSSVDCAIMVAGSRRGMAFDGSQILRTAYTRRTKASSCSCCLSTRTSQTPPMLAKLCRSVAPFLHKTHVLLCSSSHTEVCIPRLDGKPLDLATPSCDQGRARSHSAELPARSLEPPPNVEIRREHVAKQG